MCLSTSRRNLLAQCTYIWKLVAKRKIVCKYLNLLEFQIPAFRTFCKTGRHTENINYYDSEFILVELFVTRHNFRHCWPIDIQSLFKVSSNQQAGIGGSNLNFRRYFTSTVIKNKLGYKWKSATLLNHLYYSHSMEVEIYENQCWRTFSTLVWRQK